MGPLRVGDTYVTHNAPSEFCYRPCHYDQAINDYYDFNKTLLIHCQQMLESYLKPERSYIKPSHNIIHLLIRIWSIIIVCGETFHQSEKNHFEKKNLVIIITGSPYSAHFAYMLQANKLLSVTEINSYVVIISTYKLINGIHLTSFSDYFVMSNDIHQRNTRPEDNWRVPFCRLDMGKCDIDICRWNSLQQYYKSAASINNFHEKVRNFLIHQNITVPQY